MSEQLPHLPAGIYRHYKNALYQVLGYGHDASGDDEPVVIYVPLQLDGAHEGPRMAVRSAFGEDGFFTPVEPGMMRFVWLGYEYASWMSQDLIIGHSHPGLDPDLRAPHCRGCGTYFCGVCNDYGDHSSEEPHPRVPPVSIEALSETWPAYQFPVDTMRLDTDLVRQGWPAPTLYREHQMIHQLCNTIDQLREERA